MFFLARETKEQKQKSREFEKLKENLKIRFVNTAHLMYGREIKDLTKNEVYQTVAATAKQFISDNWIKTNKTYAERQEKQIYYFSIEFLLGRLLKSNLINLGIEEAVKEVLDDFNLDLAKTFEEEPDAGLGNGGLGRLAACFIDSMAAHRLPGHGCSIRYQYGLFEQKIIEGNQVEIPDNWLKNGFAWEYRKPDKAIDVKFNGNAYMKKLPDGSLKLVYENPMTVMAVPYDVPIVGYHNNTVNTLRLWNAEVNRDFSDYGRLTQEQMRQKNDYRNFVESITRYLYPDDSTYDGRRLRLIQEYFFVSAGVQSIVRHYKKVGMDIHEFAQKIAIHINDTHPALCVAELMRILVDEEGLEWNEAWAITKNTIAYTNHTIMPEALEKWPIDMFKPLLPRIYMIIDEINRRWLIDVRDRYPGNETKVHELSIIQDGMVHMARLAIVGSHSVNGVAKIHTEILKSTTLHDFYEYNPRMFNNKTNGITHRRWLMCANPRLTELICEAIGDKWVKDPERLVDLMPFADDSAFLEKFAEIKHENKKDFGAWLARHQDTAFDPDTLLDAQAKRLHEYKRQLLNVLHILSLYNRIVDDPTFEIKPRTFLFGAKAAPGYIRAKLIIKLINNVAALVAAHPRASQMIKIIFLENYGVTAAEHLMPAANLSEQLSTAGKEASGTGNMKFMMNGALTIGTMDGANIEIFDRVGKNNIFIFGLTSDQVDALYAGNTYRAGDVYEQSPVIRRIMDEMVDGTLGPNRIFSELYHALLFGDNGGMADPYLVLKDFADYARKQEMVNRLYDTRAWWRSTVINVAQSGYFSSDRTIQEYVDRIWHLKPLHEDK